MYYYPKDKVYRKYFTFFNYVEKHSDLVLIINYSELNNNDYGSIKKPIPFLNYIHGDTLALSEDDYHRNIKNYLAFGKEDAFPPSKEQAEKNLKFNMIIIGIITFILAPALSFWIFRNKHS